MDDVEIQVRRVPAELHGDGAQFRCELLHGAWHAAVEAEVEAGRLHRIGDPVLGAAHEARSVSAQAQAGASFAAHHGGGDGVAEQSIGKQVADAEIVRLVTQRTELAGDDQCMRAGIGQAEIVCAIDRRAASGAAELRDRELPHVAAKAQLVDHPGDGRGHGEAGAGDEDDRIDAVGGEPRVAKCLFHYGG